MTDELENIPILICGSAGEGISREAEAAMMAAEAAEKSPKVILIGTGMGASSVSTEELIESLNANVIVAEVANDNVDAFQQMLQHNADNMFYIRTRNEMYERGEIFSKDSRIQQPYFRQFEKRKR